MQGAAPDRVRTGGAGEFEPYGGMGGGRGNGSGRWRGDGRARCGDRQRKGQRKSG